MSDQETFSQSEDGIFLPTPTGREIRQLVFFQGLALEVDEQPEEIVKRIGHARKNALEWVELTDASFGSTIRIPMTAIANLAWIGAAWKDMAAARAQIKNMEMARRTQATGIVPAMGAPLPMPNRAARRRN